MKKLILVAMLFAASGCGAPSSYRIIGATNVEHEYVRRAFTIWNPVLPADARLHESANAEWTIEFVDRSRLPYDDGLNAITCYEKGDGGGSDLEDKSWRCPHSRWIGIDRGIKDLEGSNIQPAIVAHEIGHSLGMNAHAPGSTSLMSSNVGSDILTEEDYALCRDDGPCD